MRITRGSFLKLVAALPVAYGRIPESESVYTAREPSNYRVDPYLMAAMEIQSLPVPAAIERLHQMARDRHSLAKLSVMILCRILFKPRPLSPTGFRAPGIGVPVFVGGGTARDWPLWPIEHVDGVPFLIVTSYFVAGLPESDENYLRYCEANCDWSDVPYSVKTFEQKDAALTKCFTLYPAAIRDQPFLARQIQQRPAAPSD